MRKERSLDPHALDLLALCRSGQLLEGEWPRAEMTRLAESVLPAPAGMVAWSAQGNDREVAGSESEHWVDLRAQADVPLQCQRCLQPMIEHLEVSRRFRFVRDEDEAATLDEELEDDVLALVPRFNLQQLVEDELILALPIVPRHEVCPQPLAAAEPQAAEAAAAHPFAALAALRERGGGRH